MKIKGEQIAAACREQSIELVHGRPETSVKVRPLPLGFESIAFERVPKPRPPRPRILRDDKDQPIRYGKDAPNELRGKPMIAFDENDPIFVGQTNEHGMMIGFAQLHAAIVPGEVEWTLEEPEKREDWPAFYKGVRDDLASVGFTHGDFSRLIQAINELSGLTRAAVEEVADFS